MCLHFKMFHSIIFIVLVLSINRNLALVTLGVGDEVTVTFNGDKLLLRVPNPKKRDSERFTVCFKSHPNNVAEYCPVGYATLYYWSWRTLPESQYSIDRKGRLVDSTDKINGDVVFNSDGSVTLRVQELPYGCSVKLLNAEKVIPTTITTTTTTTTTVTAPTEKPSNNTVYYVIGGLALLFLLIVGSVIVFICWSRRSKSKKEVKRAVPLNVSDDNNNSRLTSTSSTKKYNAKPQKRCSSKCTVTKVSKSPLPVVKTQKSTMSQKSKMQPLSIQSLSDYGNNTAASNK